MPTQVSPAPHWFVAVGASGSRGLRDTGCLLADLPPLPDAAVLLAVGVILSGAPDDGSSGLAAIHHAEGSTMVLTPAERAETGGMPRNAIGYDGPIDFEGSAAQIAGEITRVVSPATGL